MILAVLSVLPACTRPDPVSIIVTGGEIDRPIAVVEFGLYAASSTWQATDAHGNVTPVQVSEDGKAQMILTDLLAREERMLTLRPVTGGASGVQATREDHLVGFKVADRPVASYHADKGPMPRADIDSIYHRAGYVHPVYTPGGRLVTDDYAPNHIHHHGIWAAWTRTAYRGRSPDFWNMGRGSGTVELKHVDDWWSGPVAGGVRAQHTYVDLADTSAVLHESWTLDVFAAPALVRVFDLTLAQHTATDSALWLVEHLYGGVGLRGHRDWDGEENTDFLTSEGFTRANGHATRARWCHVGGLVDGDSAGIAVLGHPGNWAAPQPMRIHPNEPFFNFAPSQAGAFEIPPDSVVTWRYRYVTYDGPPDRELIDALWDDYAHPAQVAVLPDS